VDHGHGGEEADHIVGVRHGEGETVIGLRVSPTLRLGELPISLLDRAGVVHDRAP
jgi:hypothetical protein